MLDSCLAAFFNTMGPHQEANEAKEAKDEQKRKKSAAIASKIKEIQAGAGAEDLWPS